MSLRCQTGGLLAIALVRFQIESAMVVESTNASILCRTAVTHQCVRHDRVQHNVDQCSPEQNAERQQEMAVCPGNRATNNADCYKRNAETLGKRLTNEEIPTWTDQTALDLFFVKGVLGYGNRLSTMV